jgi:hypothetical protein
MRYFEAPDGIRWSVEARSPGASNVMIVFRHPDGRSSRRNRYAWYVWPGAEARDVTARLGRAQVMEHLTDADLARLFRRSMPVSTETPTFVSGVAGGDRGTV